MNGKMNSKITLNLIKHWQTLCFDITFTDIGASLIQNKIISDEDFHQILTQPEGSRVKSLLLILVKKDEQLLLKFVKCLDSQYSWIAEKLREGYEQQKNRDETDAAPIVTMESDREAEREGDMEVEEDDEEEEEGESDGPSMMQGKILRKGKNNNFETDGHEHICKNKHKLSNVKSPKVNNFMYNKYKGVKRGHLTKTKVKNRFASKFENSDVVSSTTEVAKQVPNEVVGEPMDTSQRTASGSEDEEESSIKNISIKKVKKKKFIVVNTTSDEDDPSDNTDFDMKKNKKKFALKVRKTMRNGELESVLKNDITDKVITIIRRTPLVSARWTAIAHSLGLTDRIRDIRFKVGVYGEDISMCVVYLLKDWIEMFPKRAKLTKLIEVLRSERFNDVADKLTKILYGEDKKKQTVRTIMVP